MKKLNLLYKVSFLVVLAAFFFAACDPDPVFTDDPTLSLVDETGFISTSATIDGATDFQVRLSATQGTNEMNTLTILRDGSQMDASEFSIDGIAASNNPQLLIDGDRASFSYDITITPHDSGTAEYTFTVTSDIDNGDSSVSIDITVEDADPTLSIDGPSSISLMNPSFVEIDLIGTAGSSPLSTIAVFEDGTLILDLDRLACNDLSTKFTANPNFLEEGDKDGFNKMFFIESSSIVGTSVYTITITDEAGNEASVDYTITLQDLSTAITNEFSGIRMYNNAGAEPGAIDLDSGTNVSSADGSADIVDSGFDGGSDWAKTMEPLGSTDLRSIQNGATYDGITSREMLITAFDAGTSISQTGELTVGVSYLAKINEDYYIFTVADIVETTGDNLDYFVFNIKQSLN